ncbi:MAG: tRNA (adenosine(37)-N6)-threonylcarbamoyltransferase complex transferase subunit TsaD, partial [Firmicutes bacterium]|nr:tRNA (adenosine(37)-N6)-threonylcarbamoyltransferase complex transferase subunit TsaD [Bacillota bacterium]
EVAARAHAEQVTWVTSRALAEAGITFAQLDAVAVTHAPGLIGALFVGVAAAKSYALAHDLRLIGVHHLAGHVAATTWARGVRPPYVALIVSGGHTELIHVARDGVWNELGRTRDDAAGEAFDKVARALDIGYPGGPEIERAASYGNAGAVSLPQTRGLGPYEFSFSGLKSAVLLQLDRLKQAGREVPTADMAAAFQQAVIAALVAPVDEALRRTGSETLVLAGGVAANGALRQALAAVCAARGVALAAPPAGLCTDNAAMIALAGHARAMDGRFDDLTLTPRAVLSLTPWVNAQPASE